MKITVEFSALRLSNALLLKSIEDELVKCAFIMWLYSSITGAEFMSL